MSVKLIFLVISLNIILASTLPNILNTPEHACVRCLCNAVSGCFRLQNCAKYSVSYQYWQDAGAPVVDLDDTLNQEGYTKCMRNDNCIVHTIHTYTGQPNQMDCNCDQSFTCEDRLAIHYGMCDNPAQIPIWETRRARYYACSGVNMQTPPGSCVPAAV